MLPAFPNGRPRGRLGASAVAALIACTLVSACGQNAGQQAQPGAGAAPPPPEVTVVTMQPRPLTLTTELAGRTNPFQIAEVRPQITGILQKRLFTEGALVAAGAPLYQIDASTYRAALNQAKAALAKVEANVAANQLKAKRYEELADIDAVSKQARDDAVVALKQAEADVAGAKAAVQAAQINLDYTTIAAPIGGRIGRSTVTPGALVTTNQAAALATIQQLDPIYVDVTQSSADLLRLRRELASGVLKSAGSAAEARVKLVLEDGSAYPLAGRLQFAEVSVDPSSGAVTLRAIFPNPKQQLLPGMYVRAILEEGVRDAALLVPQQAVTRDPRGNGIAMVVGADGKVQPRVLTIDRALGDQWLVTGGVAAGDRVIVEGLLKARPGATVKAIEKSASAQPGADAAQAVPKSAPEPKK